tara:strand:+ start:76 stop:1071 length:996 start_codon:yes stop_codon:yes gene_type:complete
MRTILHIVIISTILNPMIGFGENKTFKKLDSLRVNVLKYQEAKDEESLKICISEMTKIWRSLSKEEAFNYEMYNLSKTNNLGTQLKIEKSKSQLQSLMLLIISIIGFIYLIYYTDKNSRKEKQKKINAAKDISSYDMLIKNKASEKLHDDIGGSLAALKMRLTQLNDPQYYSALKSEIEIIDNIYDQVRNLSKDLNIKNKFSNSLEEVLENLVEEMCTSFQNIELNIFPKEKLNNINDQEFINALALTAKELITNIIKHAKAKRITIDLTAHKEGVVLIISDDGTGFNNNKFGLGLKNINDRAILYEGEMIIDSSQKNGTTVTVKFLYIFD